MNKSTFENPLFTGVNPRKPPSRREVWFNLSLLKKENKKGVYGGFAPVWSKMGAYGGFAPVWSQTKTQIFFTQF